MISHFSSWFVTRWRVTLLLLLGALIFGLISYQYLLKREGFPPVAVPVLIVDAVYPAGDAQAVLQDVTLPLEHAARTLKNVNHITSRTTENVSILQVELDEGEDASTAAQDLRTAITAQGELPESVTAKVRTINAGAIDGQSDLLLALAATEGQSIPELEDKAEELAGALEDVPGVQSVSAVRLLEEGVNPLTGEPTTTQRSFNRASLKADGALITYPAVTLGIVAEKDANSIDLSRAVREEVATVTTVEGEYGGFEVVFTGDSAPVITQQIENLESNLLGGLIAVLVVVFLIIGLRSALITAIFLPLVLASTFGALYLFGYSLNTLTLFGVLLVLGLIVDDAIIVVEAIEVERRAGHKGLAAIRRAIDSIGVADIAGSVTTILVFAPMAFIGGILGEFIFLVPITVIIALVLSLVIALSIIPVVANLVIPAGSPKGDSTMARFRRVVEYGGSSGVEWLASKIGSLTVWYVQKPLRSIGVIVASLALIGWGVSYARLLPFQIFPVPDDGNAIYVQLTFPDGTSLASAEAYATQADQVIANSASEEIEQTSYFSGNNSGVFISITLKDLNDRSVTAAEIAEKIRTDLGIIEGMDSLVSVVGAGPPPGAYQFSITLAAAETDTLSRAADEVRQSLLGATLPSGASITELVPTDIASVVRKDGVRRASLEGKLSEGSDTAALIEVEDLLKEKFSVERIEELGLNKDGIALDLGAEGQNLESFESAVVALGAAFLLLYLILVLEFNSFIAPFLILLAVPFGIAGVIPGLASTNNSLSFFVMVGLIALAGTTVNNSIMLLEFANQARREGANYQQAIVRAIQSRFRPILATTITTVIALIPLAVSDPIWESLAYTLIFGLSASAFLIVFAFPAYYNLSELVRTKTKRYLRKIARIA